MIFPIETNIWIEACAGSGKTTLIIQRILQFLLHKTAPQKIMIITFTNSACREIQMRIEKILHRLSVEYEFCSQTLRDFSIEQNEKNIKYIQGLWKKNLLQPLQIKTIHGFCHEILQKFHCKNEEQELQIITENASKKLLEKALKKYVQNQIENNSLNHDHILVTQNWDKILSFLFTLKGKKISYAHLEKKLQKIDYDTAQIEQIQALQDLKEKDCKTHRIVLNWLKSKRNISDYYKYRELFFTKANEKRARKIKIENEILKDFVENENILRWEEFFLFDENIKKIKFFQEVNEIYQDLKKDLDLFDYDDLIVLADEKLRYDPAVRYHVDGQVNHLFVDEAQDNSPAQWRILELVIEDFFTGHGARHNGLRRTFFVVGDPKQSIFSFQGANLQEFYRKKDWFLNKAKECGHETLFVQRNESYRNGQRIVELLNRIFENPDILANFSLDSIEFSSKNDEIGAVHAHDLIENKLEDYFSDVNNEKLHLKVDEFDEGIELHLADENNQRKYVLLAKRICELIKSLKSKYHLSEIMILVQKRGKILTNLQQKLQEKNVQFYFNQGTDLKKCAFCAELINFATLICNPEIDWNWIDFANSCINPEKFDLEENAPIHNDLQSIWQTISKKNEKIANLINKYIMIANESSALKFFFILWQVFKRKLIEKFGNDVGNMFHVFLDLILDFEKNGTQDLQSFLIFWKKEDAICIRNVEQNGLQISTVHNAKGQENKVVIMADASEIPRLNTENVFFYEDLPFLHQKNNFLFKVIFNAEKQRQYQEYLRLMYVAITRAKNELHVFGLKNQQKSLYQIIETNLSFIPKSSL